MGHDDMLDSSISKSYIERPCLHCGLVFQARRSDVARGWGKYCSLSCKIARTTTSPADRFWAKVDKSGDCWIWQAGKQGRYGGFKLGGSGSPQMGAHVVALLLTVGMGKPGEIACHGCDNPLCVRPHPNHVRWGTPSLNAREREERSNMPSRAGSANPMSKLNEARILEIRELLDRHVLHRIIAIRFNVSRSTIGGIARGESWTTAR